MKTEIEALRMRTGKPLQGELDQALARYAQGVGDVVDVRAAANARLGSQPPSVRSPIPATRPLGEAPPVGGWNAVRLPFGGAPAGGIDLDTEPPIEPAAPVSVVHAQGSGIVNAPPSGQGGSSRRPSEASLREEPEGEARPIAIVDPGRNPDEDA
jgi:hypothetical protein